MRSRSERSRPRPLHRLHRRGPRPRPRVATALRRHRASAENLDFAIGSKRHPDSDVHYPASRRVASGCTSSSCASSSGSTSATRRWAEGVRREVAERGRCRCCSSSASRSTSSCSRSRAPSASAGSASCPIRLDYRFTGSGVRSLAVLRALIDTAAIFYRLRILRYYQRKRELAGAYGWTRPRGYEPLVSVRDAGRRRGLRSRLSEARGDRDRPADAGGGERCRSAAPREQWSPSSTTASTRPGTGSGQPSAFWLDPRLPPSSPRVSRHMRARSGTCGGGSGGVEARRWIALLPLHTGQPALCQ